MTDVEHAAEGWQTDPFGRHDQRWMSAGTATDLVRDGSVEGHDEPVEGPPPEPPPPKQHWVDVDRLERTRGRTPHSSTPTGSPPRPDRTPLLFIGAALTSLFLVVTYFVDPFNLGHGQNPPPHLGPDEAIGQVSLVLPSNPYAVRVTYAVAYQAPGQAAGRGGFGSGTAWSSTSPGGVAEGQSAVVRYDPKDPTIGSVVALTPNSASNGLPVWHLSLWAALGLTWASALVTWSRIRSRRARGLPDLEKDVDYRDDEWAGTTYSA